MHYPFWHVPGLTSPMLIALIATLHVFISMFAVGGSFVMAFGTHAGQRSGNQELVSYFRQFAWFFVLITVVLGAVTGVGIWWTIGLASSLATEELIHIFVFVWGMEYGTFIVEVVSAFVFFYGWQRLDARTLRIALWCYAGAAWLSLVQITGITAFMLNTGNWSYDQGLWRAFWNPQTIPQILARTGSSLMLAALYIFLHASFKLSRNEQLSLHVSKLSASWAMLGGGLVIAGGLLWYVFSPASAQAALAAAAALNILMVALFGLTAIVVVMLYLGPYRRPLWVTPGFAILFFVMGFAATAAGEFVREAVRKPYVVYGSIMSNGLRASEVRTTRAKGLLNQGVWPRLWMAEHFPQTIAANGDVDQTKLAGLSDDQKRQVGLTIFLYHCNSCHSAQGYSSVGQLARGKTTAMMKSTILELNRADFFMPPWCGTPEEADILLDYLIEVARPYPPGLIEENGEVSR
jgi:cytochrome bd ubiquinol oxidase subunit I